MKILKNKFVTMFLIFVVAIAIVVFGLASYSNSLKKDLDAFVYETMSEVTQQQRFNFTTKLNNDINSAKNLAYIVSSLSGDRDTLFKVLGDISPNSSFEYLTVVNTNGVGLVSSGDVVDISDEPHFAKALAGETVIGDPIKSQIRQAVVIPIATPIYVDGSINGVLIGSYTDKSLGELFLPSFNGNGFVFVTDRNGSMIASPNSEHATLHGHNAENLFDGMDNAQFLDGYETKDEIIYNLSQGMQGYTKIDVAGVEEFVHYSSVGINDWNIFVIAPEANISLSAAAFTHRATLLALATVMLFVLFALYILAVQYKLNREKEKYTKQLEKIAYYDSITGLPNINKFKIDAQDILEKNPKTLFIVAKLDIMNFKMINEMYGFDVGDQVVVEVARFVGRVRELKGLTGGALTRTNADEFILMDETDGDSGEIITRTKMFEEEFNKQIGGLLGTHRVEFRYGGYFLEPGATDINGAIEKANIAHGIAKSKKNNNICFYDDAFKQRIRMETEIANRMEFALANDEFQVYLQPKYGLNGETVVGAEALARWRMQNGQLVMPGDFIPLFERNGFVIKLDMYMFESVCKIMRQWIDEGRTVVTVSVNFSRAHLTNSGFVAELEEIVSRYDVPKKNIEIELSESTIFDNEEVLEKLLNDLHRTGFTLSMDDFGTGYSSLGLLQNLAVDVVKIDRSFFVNNKHKSRAKAVIESIMYMTKKLKINTVAEGVETQEHIDLLREVGCDSVQGFYYARPLPAAEFYDTRHQFIPPAAEGKELAFDISKLGDMEAGRSLLGDRMPVAVYRLFQFTLREVLNQKYGDGETFETFRKSGEMAGRAYANQYLNLTLPFDGFIENLKACLLLSKIGVLNVESVDEATGALVITVEDDLDCSGTPNLGSTLCQYDEGFIAGILYEYTKKEYSVLEVDCWGTGSDLCRFNVNPK